MLTRTTRLAPALLAMVLAGLAMGCSAVRAEPAAPASGTPDNCLANPSGPSPAGSHWYYRIERHSGRHCWYLRQRDAKANQSAEQGEHAAPHPLPAPVRRPSAEKAPDTLAGSADNVRSAAPPMSAPPTPSVDWPTPMAAPSEPAPSEPGPSERAPARSGSSAVEPVAPPAAVAIDPTPDAQTVAPAPAPAPEIAPQPLAAERPPATAMGSEHIPALLGTGLVLVLIILGSIAFRIAARFARRPRRQAMRESPVVRWDASYSDAPLAPEIMAVDAPAAAPLRTEGMSDPIPEPVEPAARRSIAPNTERESLFEADVRELLRRLPMELSAKRAGLAVRVESESAPDRAAPTPAPPLVPGDLNAALAVWRGRRG